MEIKYAGVDLSSWNGDVDFSQLKTGTLKNIPITFVMIRISVDKSVDKNAVKNIKAALNAGFDVGVYHYTNARSVSDAKAEANLVMKTIKDNGFDGKLALPVAFDIEENDVLKLGKDACTAISKAFMDEIAAADYQPMLYTYAAAYNSFLNKDELKDYPFWVAAYIPEKTLNNTYGIKDYAMWQFGVAGNADYDLEIIGKVAGVKGQCDVDYMYEDLAAKIKAEGKNGFSPAAEENLYTLKIENINSRAFAEELLTTAENAGFSGTITEQENRFEIGDQVRIQDGAPIYGTGDKFAAWVYTVVLYVREINGDRVLVSTRTTGAVTGPVDKKYLTKV